MKLTDNWLDANNPGTIADLPRNIAKFIRGLAGTSGKPYPIRVVSGCQSPKLVGESYYWTTPSGKTRITYPSSYRWAKVYHHSTRETEVGFEWLKSLAVLGINALPEAIYDYAVEHG